MPTAHGLPVRLGDCLVRWQLTTMGRCDDMPTIRTRYFGATNTSGAKIRVTDGMVTRTYSYEYDGRDNQHVVMAERFALSRYGASSVEYVSETRSGKGNIYRVSVGGAE